MRRLRDVSGGLIRGGGGGGWGGGKRGGGGGDEKVFNQCVTAWGSRY